MKKLLPLLFVFACKDQRLSATTTDDIDESDREIREVVNSLVYFKDHRTNICFAWTFVRRGYGNASVGGPAMATVDCSMVADRLMNGPERRILR